VADFGNRVAAIDIGTVSTRLLIADVRDGEVNEVLRHTIITHLGEGLTRTGRLSEEAMARVTGVIQGFMRDCAEAGVESIMAVATSASRDASNGEELMAKLDALGVRPEIISGGREAQLSFLGATYGMEDEVDILVADIGGGSTELIFGNVSTDDGKREIDIDSARSIDVGSRRATEMFLLSDPPRCEERDAAVAWMADELRPFFDALRERPRCLLALAGTATSLAAIHLGLPQYDMAAVHWSKLSGGDVVQLKDDLARMTVEERKAIPSLDPGRASVIVAGAMLLETVLALAGLDQVTVSEHDILYGMVLTAAGE
jgi:exopolyphosphatase / guanosine-5'-triphosphate,3'-diphosphate pyrophosphatase